MQLGELESGELNVLNEMLIRENKKVLRVNAGGNSGMLILGELQNSNFFITKRRQGSIPCVSIVAKSLKATGGINRERSITTKNRS